jgi:LysR family transcriptional regulator, regulator for bpeEF and oprC
MGNNSVFRKINLNHIPVFAAIAESKSITAAARIMGYEKTRVSRILTEFESDLDTELVFRTTRALRLTKAGELFYIQCKKMLADLEDATDQLGHRGGEVSGHIRLTAAHGVATALLPQTIKEFNARYPQVTFEIILTQQSLNLVKEGIDLAFRVGALESSSYKSRKIADCQFAFAATPQFLKSRPPLNVLKDLNSVPTITLPNYDKTSLIFSKPGEDTRLKLTSAIVTNSPTVIMDLTLMDLGVGFLPEFICRDYFKTGQLIRLFEQWNTSLVPISLVFHASSRKNQHVSLFITFLSTRLKKIYLDGAVRAPSDT